MADLNKQEEWDEKVYVAIFGVGAISERLPF
jgi:hypothetical protein